MANFILNIGALIFKKTKQMKS